MKRASGIAAALEHAAKRARTDSAPAKTQPAPPSPPQPAGAGDADDPLDAFMAEINKSMTAEKRVAGEAAAARKGERLEEDEDAIDYYVQAKAIEAEDAAAAADREQEFDDNDVPVQQSEEEALRLAPVDHSAVTYEPARKQLYKPHPEVAAMSETEVSLTRIELNATVAGHSVPAPISTFMHAGFDPRMLQGIVKAQLEAPTPIQAQAIPILLAGRDTIAIARTGSGKTLAYVWPLLMHVLAQRRRPEGAGPAALVMAPTRELTEQIVVETKRFAKPLGLVCAGVYGGASKYQQSQWLKAGVDVVVGTPGRLIDMVKMKALVTGRLSFVVLDEADRMLDMGFEAQVMALLGQVRPDRQMALFSATLRPRVDRLARRTLLDPVRITIGDVGSAHEGIQQDVVVMRSDADKWGWLTAHLPDLLARGKVLVFVTSVAGAEALAHNLAAADPMFRCEPLHGDRHQSDRSSSVRKFRDGVLRLLVATDVAARGLDVPDIVTVVNYDAARSLDVHVHRVGRTARMQTDGPAAGRAVTLLTHSDAGFAGALVDHFEKASMSVPPALMELASKDAKWRGRRRAGKQSGGAAASAPRGAPLHTTAGLGFGAASGGSARPSPMLAAGGGSMFKGAEDARWRGLSSGRLTGMSTGGVLSGFHRASTSEGMANSVSVGGAGDGVGVRGGATGGSGSVSGSGSGSGVSGSSSGSASVASKQSIGRWDQGGSTVEGSTAAATAATAAAAVEPRQPAVAQRRRRWDT